LSAANSVLTCRTEVRVGEGRRSRILQRRGSRWGEELEVPPQKPVTHACSL